MYLFFNINIYFKNLFRLFSVADFFLCLIMFFVFYIFYINKLFLPLYVFPEIFFFLSLLSLFLYYIRMLWYFNGSSFLKGSGSVNLNIVSVISSSLYFQKIFEFLFLLLLISYFCLFEYLYLTNNTLFLFYGSFFLDALCTYCKFLVTFLAYFVILSFKVLHKNIKPEFFIIFGFSFLSLLFLISSYNFLFFLVSLESFSFSVYLLLCLFFTNKLSVEASFKYFILSAFSSAFLLLAISFFFGLFGTFSFSDIALLCLFPFNSILHRNFCIALFIFLVGLFFKLALAPFHAWVFDVYEGASYPIMMYLLICSKVVVFYLLYLYSYKVFLNAHGFLMLLFPILASITLLISGVLAVTQINVKRFLICSSLVNTGILFLSLASFTFDGIVGFFLYLTFYNISFLFFLLWFFLLRKEVVISNVTKPYVFFVTELSSLTYIKNIPLRVILSTYLLSFIGIPPFIGFFIKYYIIFPFILTKKITLILLFLAFFFVNAYYYLRLIKLLWFVQGLFTITGIGYSINIFLCNHSFASTFFLVFFSIYVVNAAFYIHYYHAFLSFLLYI